VTWRLEEVPALAGYTVEWADSETFWYSRRNRLFASSCGKADSPLFITAINAPRWKQVISRLRLCQRFLRFLVTNVIVLRNGDMFVAFDKTVGIVHEGKYKELKGLKRPCRIMRGGCAVDDEGAVYFGEYTIHAGQVPIAIYKYQPGDSELRNVYEFPASSIRHVHGIYKDPYSPSMFCLTGDYGAQCKVLRTDDGFKTTVVVGEGNEKWRAVSMVFTENHLYYGTDAEFESNHFLRLGRQGNSQEILGEIDGPVFFSTRVGKDIFVTTAAQDAPSQRQNVARLMHIDQKGQIQEIANFPKDRWHKTLFMLGTIHFSQTQSPDTDLYVHLVGVHGDNRTYRLCGAPESSV
jgi:hypothetical protein